MDALAEPGWLSLARFLGFALLAIVGPGLALSRLLRAPRDPALVIPLGTAFLAAVAWVEVAFGLRGLVPALALGLDSSLLRPERPARPWTGPSLSGALPASVAFVGLLASAQYGWNRLQPSGAFQLDPLVPFDAAFHAGLTFEISTSYPPQVPGVSGFPLGYHLGPDLVRSAAWVWAGVHPLDSLTRFDVTLLGLALILALRSASSALGFGPRAVALSGFAPLLADFSWVLAPAPQAHWWVDLLRGNLLVSLVHANPVVPALAMALGCLACLARFEQEPTRGALLSSLTLALAVPFFKVFLGAQLCAGLLLAGLLAAPGRRLAPLAAAAASALGTLALATGTGGETVQVLFAPLDLVAVTRAQFALPPLQGLALLPFAALWLLLSLGLRLVGIAPALRALAMDFAPGRALAVMALSGWPLGLLFRISAPEVLPGQSFVNDAAYFVEQSGPLLWLFAFSALELRFGSLLTRLPMLATLAALCLPSSLQFALKKRSAEVDALPAPMVAAMVRLEQVSFPGDVVLQRPGARFPPAPVILIGRRVPYERFTPYLTQFTRRDELSHRHAEVYGFFQTRDPEEARALARKLGARFVALYGGDRVRFGDVSWLEPIHQAGGARVYRIRD